MKLTDFLQDVGRPVAYYPKMKRITGSTTATILLCQFIYWRGKEADKDGWLYKTSEEIEEETGLTYNEQKTARKALTEAGLIQEHYARLDHQMRFLVNLDAINEKWGIEQPIIPESDDSMFGNDESPYSLNSNTENTTQNKHKPKTIEEAIFSNQPVTEEMLDNGIDTLNDFEKVFGFGTLPWYSNTTWDRFAKWLIKNNNGWFADYVAWRESDGKYKAFSNRKIRENPQAFMDTGYPEYEAGKMYRKTDETRPEYKPFIDEREGLDFAPNPKVKR